MAKLSSLRIDAGKDLEGVWTSYAVGIELKIARLGNPNYRAYMRKIGRPHKAQLRHGLMDDDKLEMLSKEALAHTVLLDWRNVEDDNGTPIQYTPERGLELFEDPEYADLYSFVVDFANTAENYRNQEMQEAVKNSLSTCDGIGNGDETLPQ